MKRFQFTTVLVLILLSFSIGITISPYLNLSPIVPVSQLKIQHIESKRSLTQTSLPASSQEASIPMEAEDTSLEWRKNPPLYKEEPVIAFYVTSAKENQAWQITQPQVAESIISMLNFTATIPAPDENTDYGYMIITPERRYPIYPILSENEQIRILIEATQNAILDGIPVVDIFLLLAPNQIERIEFEGHSENEEGELDHILMQTENLEEITRILTTLRKITFHSMTLYSIDEQPSFDTNIIIIPNSYSMTLYLGPVYNNATCKIIGYPHAFWVSLNFQKTTRLYACEPDVNVNVLNIVAEIKNDSTLPLN